MTASDSVSDTWAFCPCCFDIFSFPTSVDPAAFSHLFAMYLGTFTSQTPRPALDKSNSLSICLLLSSRDIFYYFIINVWYSYVEYSEWLRLCLWCVSKNQRKTICVSTRVSLRFFDCIREMEEILDLNAKFKRFFSTAGASYLISNIPDVSQIWIFLLGNERSIGDIFVVLLVWSELWILQWMNSLTQMWKPLKPSSIHFIQATKENKRIFKVKSKFFWKKHSEKYFVSIKHL